MKSNTINLIIKIITFFSCDTILTTAKKQNMAEKQIILTFDDGPYERPEVDDRLLDVLKENGVKAFFNIIGRKIKNNPEIIKRMYREGHVISNHTWDHKPVIFQSRKRILSDMEKFNAALSGILGFEFKAKYFRPSLGIKNKIYDDIMKKNNFKYVPVTHFPKDPFLTGDSYGKYLEWILKIIEKQNGGIIVIHNGLELLIKPSKKDFTDTEKPINREWIPEFTANLLKTLKRKGYYFSIDGLD